MVKSNGQKKKAKHRRQHPRPPTQPTAVYLNPVLPTGDTLVKDLRGLNVAATFSDGISLNLAGKAESESETRPFRKEVQSPNSKTFVEAERFH
jgi:hypothetical protein